MLVPRQESIMQMGLTLACVSCDSQVDWPHDAVSTTHVMCADCGRDFGTLADIEESVGQCLRDFLTLLDAEVLGTA
jgi:hypothetical protein